MRVTIANFPTYCHPTDPSKGETAHGIVFEDVSIGKMAEVFIKTADPAKSFGLKAYKLDQPDPNADGPNADTVNSKD